MRDGQIIGLIVGGAVLLLGVGTYVATRDHSVPAAETGYPAVAQVRVMTNPPPATRLVAVNNPATTRAVVELVRLDPKIEEQRREIDRLTAELRKSQLAIDDARKAMAAKAVQAQAGIQNDRSQAARKVYEQILKLKVDRTAGVSGEVFGQHLSDASFSLATWQDELSPGERKAEPCASLSKAIDCYQSIQKAEKVLPDTIATAKKIEYYDNAETVSGKWKIVTSIQDLIQKAEKEGDAALSKAKQHL